MGLGEVALYAAACGRDLMRGREEEKGGVGGGGWGGRERRERNVQIAGGTNKLAACSAIGAGSHVCITPESIKVWNLGVPGGPVLTGFQTGGWPAGVVM